MNSDIINMYLKWVQCVKNSELSRELVSIQHSQDKITDRFWRELSFGTGGLRGIMGAGTNRMNIYTVGKATQGLANYLLSNTTQPPTVCIAFDTRHHSREFAERAASVLCGNSIHVYLYDCTHPTPMLSFMVRHKQADAGIVITASHNPAQYNGYKVYGADGGQVTDSAAKIIQRQIDHCDIFNDVKSIPLEAALEMGLLRYLCEHDDAPYYEQVASLILQKELLERHAAELKVLYTPLHGSGNQPVKTIMQRLGFRLFDVVAEQESPDGDFPTVPCPNPEDLSVYGLAIRKANRTNPDLIFATDPDCDRIGVMSKTKTGNYVALTGNQVGALLCEYILSTQTKQGTLPSNAAIIKTIVTSDLAKAICKRYNVHLEETLTGFKYIGEKVEEWESSAEYTFLLGFEESYGFLAGSFVRDKDAIIASALISEMALYYKTNEMTLYDALLSLYETYGFFQEGMKTVEKHGPSGQQEIHRIMDDLRTNYINYFQSEEIVAVEDYGQSLRCDPARQKMEAIALPKSNVLKIILPNGWIVFRPSGTEPKIKAYFSVNAIDMRQVELQASNLKKVINTILNL